MLRYCILNEDFEQNARFCGANELEKAYSDMIFPNDVVDFSQLIFNNDILHSDNSADGGLEIYEESYTRFPKTKNYSFVYHLLHCK